MSSKCQLALLLLFQEITSCKNCVTMDPVFSATEKAILSSFQIEYNSSTEYQCQSDTLLFMPHCCIELYDNILWANWGLRLKDIMIVGNSFKRYADDAMGDELVRKAGYVARACVFVSEEPLRTSFRVEVIFMCSHMTHTQIYIYSVCVAHTCARTTHI